MAGGFISGLVWGTLFCGAVGAVASVYYSGSYKGLLPLNGGAEQVVVHTDQPAQPEPAMPQSAEVKPALEGKADAPQAVANSGGSAPAPVKPAPVKPAPVKPVAPQLPSDTPNVEPTPDLPSGQDLSVEPADLAQPAADPAVKLAPADGGQTALPGQDEPAKPAPGSVTPAEKIGAQTVPKPEEQPKTEPEKKTEPETPVAEKSAAEEKPVAENVEQPVAAPPAAEQPAPVPDAPQQQAQTNAPEAAPKLPVIIRGGRSGKEAEAKDTSSAQDVARPIEEQGALQAFAAKFDNPKALPVVAVVLVSSPDAPVDADVLASLPMPISIAIDAADPGAGALADTYRKQGHEVLMLTNLPAGAKAGDIEVAFEAYKRALPDAVAMLDLGQNGFLRGASTASQLADILSEDGLGLVTPSKGLNSAQKAAMRKGVPAALIYRALDDEGENARVIRRYLDRAAFRAKQEGQAVMLGQMRAETIQALVQWALEDRAASVAVGPVSAVLQQMQAP
ncbi:MAG: hypothetical protein CSA68_02105 [Rhodobacterales bacterium]|nr:MAG: hypothetical protein CSA68_02105 [Rhodobacterales bacterium]